MSMSITLLIYWVLAKMISTVDSASLGNGVFDTLVPSDEAPDDYLSNEMPLTIFRRTLSQEELINRAHYEGYIFDQNNCIQFNDRIHCGYDKNRGTQLDDYTMLDIGNGCRTRADRIECGYENPPFYQNLRHPGVAHGKSEDTHDKYSVGSMPHDNKHHLEGNHQESLTKQAPTRTAMITDPTTESIELNKIKTDYLENKLLKNSFDKLGMKDTSKESLKTTTDYIKLITSSTDTEIPLHTTTTEPTTHKPTLTSEIQNSKSTTSTSTTNNATTSMSTTNKATPSTSTTEITTTPTSLESNEISDSETIKRIVKIARPKKENTERLTEMSSKLPELERRYISGSTVVPSIITNFTTSSNGAVSPEKAVSEEMVKTACVEEGDRIVCYDFKT